MPTTGIEMYTCIPFLEEKIERLEEENQQLKIQISAREEKYRELEDNYKKLKKYIISKLEDKIVELERGVSNVED